MGPTQRGSLVLHGDGLNFGIIRTKVSDIRAVEQEDDACRVLVSSPALSVAVIHLRPSLPCLLTS